MSDSVLFDTDVLIDVGRGVEAAINYLEQAGQQSVLAVGAVTQMEMLVGCRNKTELQAVERFLARFQILKLNEEITDTAISLLRTYRLSHGLLIPDALIAATALVFDMPLATQNQKDYRFIAGLRLQSY
jgi:predicted nucleic acid-binding protein